jgi:hypothetical protein
MGQWRQQIISNEESQAATNESDSPPWWSTSNWLPIVVAIGTAVFLAFFMFLIFPSNSSVFLIGDEKGRQDRADKRRKYILGIGATLIVGIASSLIASLR